MNPEIITAIVGGIVALLGGDALLRLIFYRSSRKKADAEAAGVETQNESAAVETLKNALTILQTQIDYMNGQLSSKDQTIQALQEEKSRNLARLQALYDDMCVHKGCKLRKPHQGQGQRWYEEHADDPSLGCDFMSVEWMLKQWRARNLEKAVEVTED